MNKETLKFAILVYNILLAVLSLAGFVYTKSWLCFLLLTLTFLVPSEDIR